MMNDSHSADLTSSVSVTGMNDDIMDFLSRHGVSLSPIGVAGYGLHHREAVQLIEIVRKNHIVILGGDVYRMTEKLEIECAYLDWFTDEKNIPAANLSSASCDIAIEHIKKAVSLCGETVLIDLVFEGSGDYAPVKP